MKNILLVFLVFFSFAASAQKYNSAAGNWGSAFNRIRIDSIILLPKLADTNVHKAEDSVGSLKYAVQDKSLRVWNGAKWVNVAGGGGGSTTLAGLVDVALTSLIDSQLLMYKSGLWINWTPNFSKNFDTNDFKKPITYNFFKNAANFPALNQSTTGNAGTATALLNPRNINGVAFDGTGNITVTAVPSGTAAGDLAGTYPTPTIKPSVALTTPDIGAATGTSLTVTGQMRAASYRFDGSTSGNVVMRPPASVTSYTVVLPATVGTAGQVLTLSDNAGTAAWTTPAPAGVAHILSGDANGITVGASGGTYTITPLQTSTPTASKPMAYGTHAESYAVNYVYTTASTATSGGTLTLTNASGQGQNFTGSSSHTVYLPVTSTLTTSHRYYFSNFSTGTIYIYSSGGNIVDTLLSGEANMLQCQATGGTTASDWYLSFSPKFNVYSEANTAVVRDRTGRIDVDSFVATGNTTYTLPADIGCAYVSIKPTTTSNYNAGTTLGGSEWFGVTSCTGGAWTRIVVNKEYGGTAKTISFTNSGGGSTTYKIKKD